MALTALGTELQDRDEWIEESELGADDGPPGDGATPHSADWRRTLPRRSNENAPTMG